MSSPGMTCSRPVLALSDGARLGDDEGGGCTRTTTGVCVSILLSHASPPGETTSDGECHAGNCGLAGVRTMELGCDVGLEYSMRDGYDETADSGSGAEDAGGGGFPTYGWLPYWPGSMGGWYGYGFAGACWWAAYCCC